MNEDRDAEIYRRHLAGEMQKSLAQEFGLTATSIREICREMEWRAHHPDKAATMSQRDVRALLWLESRGHTVILR